MDVVTMTSSTDFMSLNFSILAVVMLVSYSNMLQLSYQLTLAGLLSKPHT